MSIDSSKIPVAVPSKSKLDLTCDHVTTMSFGSLQCVHYRHPLKGERVNLQGVATIRPFPLACPTFGRLRCNVHHFFVPWRIVFPQYESFYNDTVAVNYDNASLIDEAPSFTNDLVAGMFLSTVPGLYANLADIITGYQQGDPYDFYTNNNYYKFTRLGKSFYKMLCSLGYEINFDIKDSVSYSALPILAWCKVYLDYYTNQSYLDTQDVLFIRKILAYNNPTAPLVLDVQFFATILSWAFNVQYEQDYFVGAWDNPFAPNSGQFSAISFDDVILGTSVIASTNGSPYMRQNSNVNTSIGTKYMHDVLNAVTDYSKRHQLAGASNINRVLAQYGFGVDHLRLDRAIHIQGSSIDINTGAVFSTANTARPNEPSTLGDYAGNGFGQGNSDFSYVCEEMGILITFASILPSGGYYQGTDENNMHVKRFDFFTPEFDTLSTQVLRRREVYVSRNGDRYASTPTDYELAFGHTSRYAEYKRPRSWISGDFRVPTRFNGASSWHLFRTFDDNTFGGTVGLQSHSPGFTRMIDAESYRRIFTYTDGDNDPFYAEFHWNVGAFSPCHPLFEGYQFETDDNKKVNLESQGALVN